MKQIWVVFLHAREFDTNPSVCHTLVELVSADKKKIDDFVQGRVTEHIVTIEGVECEAHRAVHPAVLEE